MTALAPDPAHVQASRQVCRRTAPNIWFSSHFLPKDRRAVVYCVVSVYDQLRQIINSKGAADSEGEGCCEEESPEKRKSVCHSVLDYLYRGEPTGKGELDGFHAVAQQYDLPRQPFDNLIDALIAEQSVQRYATWKRVNEQLNLTAGSAGELIVPAFAGDAITDTARHQIHAWCTAMRLAVILTHIPQQWKHGRLLLPLDDLVRFKLTEHDVSGFIEAKTCDGDPRWRDLMTFEADRARNLFRGGAQFLESINDQRVRRAVATLGVLYSALLETIERHNGDVFDLHPQWSYWQRLKRYPRAVKLAADPSHASMF